MKWTCSNRVTPITSAAFLFYVWLCVVSHFQLLRELDKLGLSSLEHVEPFHNEDGDTTMDENDDDYPTKSNLDNPNDEAYNPQDENPTLTDTVSLEDAVIDDFEVAEKRIEWDLGSYYLLQYIYFVIVIELVHTTTT